MFITAEAVPVYLALIGLATLIVQSLFASRERAKAAEKLNEIHTLTNSGMTEVRGKLETALARIDELNKSATASAAATLASRTPFMPPMPGTLPPPAPDPPPPPPRPVPSLVVPSQIMEVATLAGIAAAATSVADAAVEKKDEIVGSPKK